MVVVRLSCGSFTQQPRSLSVSSVRDDKGQLWLLPGGPFG